MKKNNLLLAVAALFFAISVNAQVVNLFNGFGTSVPNPGDSFSVRITNTDTFPKMFYMLTKFDKPGDLIFADKPSFLNHMIATGDPMAYIREYGRIVKSPSTVHCRRPAPSTYGINGFDTLLARKQYSPCAFFLSNASQMCGERQIFFDHLTKETQMIPLDSLRTVILSGHTVGEVFLNGDTILNDPDDGEPRYLDTIPGVPQDHMSAQDVREHSEWLDSSRRYCYTKENGECYELSHVTNKFYSEFFTRDPIIYDEVKQFESSDMDGKIILLPGQTLTFSFVSPAFIIDTGNPVIAHDFYEGMKMTDSLGIDGMMPFFRNLFPRAPDSALLTIFTQFNFLIVNGNQWEISSCNFWREKFTVHTHIPAQPGQVNIGPDMRMPFIYISSTATNPFQLGHAPEDTIVQNSRIEVFNPDPSDNELQISTRALQFIQAGKIPAQTTVDMELRYNNLIYEFFSGIRAEMFGGDSTTLRVETYPAIATPTSVATVAKTTFAVYPSPNNGTFTVACEDYRNIGIIEVYDIVGKKLKPVRLTSGQQQMQVDWPKGMYFLKAGNSTAKKIIIE